MTAIGAISISHQTVNRWRRQGWRPLDREQQQWLTYERRRRTQGSGIPRPGAVRDNRRDHEVHERRMQTGWRTAHAGSRLKPLITQEGTAWKASLPAVLGKTRRTE